MKIARHAATEGRVPGEPAAQPPLVSVIMIFLNARKYIADAIESVLTQSLVSWELVLVDDGSSDGSREVAAGFAASHPGKICIYEHTGRRNLGTGPSRNLGMQMARGSYLAFLDADDIYEPLRLERTVQLLEANPELGVVINRECYWHSWQPSGSGNNRLARRPDEIVGPSAVYEQVMPPPVLIATTIATRGAAMPAVCSITFRRQSITELGGVPEIFASQYEDQALICKLLLNRSAMVIEDCLARYRQHRESLTHRAMESGAYRPGRPHAEREQFIRWLLDYARSLGIDEPVLMNAIADELAAPRRRVALALDAIRRWLRRALLMAANAILPQSAVDRLIRWYLERQRRTAARTAARHTSAIGVRDNPGDDK
jgi:glycosyltransferase involved in cell wall biosynthesis